MIEFRYIKKPICQAFTLCFLVAVLLFLPMTLRDVMDGNVFHYVGDYNAQELTFWEYCNEFIKQGGSFSWEADLGSGFVNAFSYYGLGSIFFWISEWCPSKFMPWFMVVLFCLKFAIAGVCAYVWAKRWVKEPQFTIIVSVLYAFFGGNIYNIFYNHFLDAVALFPLLLAALDSTVIDKKHGFFPLVVALNLLTNYYFFIGEIIFLAIYFVGMMLGKAYRINLKVVAQLAFESVLGVAMGCLLLLPAVISLAQNPRTSNFLNDYGFICYDQSQKYMAILCSMFLMPDVPYSDTIFPYAGVKWQSLSAFLPVVGIIGGVALNRAERKHPFSRILKFSVVCAFVPMLNALFTLENSAYYARWFYMPILILCAATGMALEDSEIRNAQWMDAWKTVFIFTVAFASLGLVPSTVELFGTQLGVTKSPSVFWLLWGISIAGLVAGAFAVKKNKEKQRLASAVLSVVVVFSFIYGETHILLSRYTSETQNSEHSWVDKYSDLGNIDSILPENSYFYRTETLGGDNFNILLNKRTESFFSSTVSPGIFKFYRGLGLTRGVRSNFSEGYYGLRSLLSTKFIMVSVANEDAWSASALDEGIEINESNVDDLTDLIANSEDTVTYSEAEWAKNWKEYGRTDEFVIYENQNYIPMGFTYNYYITEEQYNDLTTEQAVNILLKALVLTDDQIEKYKDVLQPLPEAEFDNCTYEAYEDDCAVRRESTVDSFEANNYGFTATTNYADDELVFFSVPYEKNAFTATVNGQPVEVEEVDCGLMAIPVPAGKTDIVVTYHTPGLKLSTTITISGIIIWIAYAYVCNRKKKTALLARMEAN